MEKSFNIVDNQPAFATVEGRKWLISMLAMGPATITFTKSDGSERVMNCTLQENVAVKVEKKTDRVKTVNEDVLPVYDLDAKGWRSFRLDSIKQVKFDL